MRPFSRAVAAVGHLAASTRLQYTSHASSVSVTANRSLGSGAFSRVVLATPTFARGFRVDMEATPNPDSMKFIPEGQVVLPKELGSGMHFSKVEEAGNSRLVRQLLKLKHVKSVFLGPDFLSINKTEHGEWMVLRPLILGAIMDVYAEGKPIIVASQNKPVTPGETALTEADKEIIALIEELFETRIRPAVQEDGGDIFFVAWDADTGIVKLRMAGSCVGCPSSSQTLKNGVESMLMHYIPEVNGIEQLLQSLDSRRIVESFGCQFLEPLGIRYSKFSLVENDPLTELNKSEVSELEQRLASAGVPK